MKIGFVVHFFDFRNDVRRVIAEVSRFHEVVVFARQADVTSIQAYLPDHVELRVIKEKRNTVFNYWAEQLFRFFGKLPKSSRNYYLMEVFKISMIGNPATERRAKRLLDWSMHLPKWLGYDEYLTQLRYQAGTKINDIDRFILFTDISDDYFFARLLNEKNEKIMVYVYSWDHPCKQKRYSKRSRYLVWNEGLRQDMIELQHVNPAHIQVTGASQFAYINQFLSLPVEVLRNPFPFRYVYFGCAIGAPVMATHEVKIIQQVSAILFSVDPEVKLVVRPYPVLKNWEVYRSLSKLPNVVMDDQYKSKDLSIAEADLMDKFIRMHYAQAFVHLGTTLGFEACFTDTPSLILDFDTFKDDQSPLSVYNFVHQYQNEKYLLLRDYPNVISSAQALSEIIPGLIAAKSDYLHYNRAIRATTQLKSFEQFAVQLADS